MIYQSWSCRHDIKHEQAWYQHWFSWPAKPWSNMMISSMIQHMRFLCVYIARELTTYQHVQLVISDHEIWKFGFRFSNFWLYTFFNESVRWYMLRLIFLGDCGSILMLLQENMEHSDQVKLITRIHITLYGCNGVQTVPLMRTTHLTLSKVRSNTSGY